MVGRRSRDAISERTLKKEMRRSSPRRRTGRGTSTPCPRASREQLDRTVAKLKREKGKEIFEKWTDPTRGSRSRRLDMLKRCGSECFACPNSSKPMYPVCAEDCSPRCAGISAAIGYAHRYGADGVADNLRELEEECRRLRHAMRRRSRRRSSSGRR